MKLIYSHSRPSMDGVVYFTLDMIDTAAKKRIANWLLNPDNPGDLPLAEAERKIKEFGLEKVYREIELPLVEILEDMKRVGIGLDRKRLAELKKEADAKIKKLEEEIFKLAGGKFNLNSPRQLSFILFEKLGLDSGSRAGMTKKNAGVTEENAGMTKGGIVTRGGITSTRAGLLKKLQDKHPIVGLILKYREEFKIKSTYLEPLSRLGERARTVFIQTGTATGRLASQNPNLQNIPPAVKEAFIADNGYQLAAFDYSQIELRILAALSQDKKMLAAFAEGRDIHALTASQVFNAPIDKVTPEMRRVAKTLNFGVVYGMGPNTFAGASGLTIEEARKFIAEYFSDFKEIKKWQERVKNLVRKNGFAENLNGRKRWLPAINSQSRYLAAAAERMAINMPVQSLGADVIKLAMIAAHRRFRNDKSVRLLLSIHDELLFEIKSDKVNERIKEIKKLMENVYRLPGARLEVKVKVGKNWGR